MQIIVVLCVCSVTFFEHIEKSCSRSGEFPRNPPTKLKMIYQLTFSWN
jgi:hypothetical protein